MGTTVAAALGGALGAVGRYGVGVMAAGWPPGMWPWATFTVNALGGFAIGLLAAVFAATSLAGEWRVFWIVGVLGGFTTFSAFSLELAVMLERRAFALAVGYAFASVLVCVAAALAGLILARRAWA